MTKKAELKPRGKKPAGARPLSFQISIGFETESGFPDLRVAGVDEVGRGCLAGPVVAGALILPVDVNFERDPWLKSIKDSKLLTPEQREKLYPKIQNWALAYGIGTASVEEIDRINIYHASHLAMVRAVGALSVAPHRILVDGNVVPRAFTQASRAIVKGDQKCLSIAAASILAKVWRDRQMAELDRVHPGYGFAVHKGYSTPAHSKALKELGPCAIHRQSFAPVAELLQQSLSLV